MKKLLLLGAILLSFSSNAQLTVQQFDDPWTGTPPAPPQWKVVNGGGAGVTWEQTVPGTEYPPFGGTGHAALLKIDPASPTNPVQEDWLISPMFYAPANASVHFQSRLLQNGNQGSVYKVMIGSNANDLSSFTTLYTATELEMNPEQTQYMQKNIAIPAQYVFQQVHIAFVMIGSSADGWLVDDVGIVSNCPSPTSPVASMTGTSATLSWTNSSNASAWEIEVIPGDAVPSGIGTIINGQTPFSVSATTSGEAFLPDTVYKYYVRAICPDGGVSTWVGPVYFPDNNCPAPLNVEVTSADTQSITYSWTASGAASYDYWYTSTNDLPNESTVPSGSVATTTATISPLNPEMTYKFYVRSNCGVDGQSFWVGLPQLNPLNNVIHGIVQYDSNANGVCDAGDVGLPYTEVQVEINDFSYSVYTNQYGQYNLYGWQEGTYTVNLQVVSPLFTSIDPVVQEVTFDDEVNNVVINHCLGAPLVVNDLEVTFLPLGVARPGFDAYYRVVVKNSGTLLMEDVTLNLSFDNNRIDYVSSVFAGTTATGGNLVIPVGDIQPFNSAYGNVIFLVKQPPVNVGNEILNFESSLSAVANDATPENNVAVLNQTIVNSYDPNDITVHEGAEIYEGQAGDYLTYTIRFQNTGTAEAINIRLENTLDDLLDWSTFKPIASSHIYEVKRTDNLLEFEYKDIYLPDSTANEPGSHGFVTYKIKPKAEYGLGDIVSNTAEIYFDFNEAIITNTATTEVVEILGLNDNALTIARLYPNPVKDQLHVEVAQGELQSVAVYDINGRLCLSANNSIIDTYTLKSGIYFVKITTDTGSAGYKLIKH
ncbi:MAG: hypothetical protein DI539_00520 [Flavobacterium psychrophilum]|nr:MAG: hypothetical protein DI539_00520 [Flavobacterium psychrophilum]